MFSTGKNHAVMKTAMRWTVLALSVLILNACTLPWQQQSAHTTHWTYSGLSGPEYWGKLDAKNERCLSGYEQSPIDIQTQHVEATAELEPIVLNYQPLEVGVMNNGHTIQANVKNAGNQMILQGIAYDLVQFHFHLPSEHQFNGEAYEMEVHFVHKNKEGVLAVLGILIQVGAEHNLILQEMFEKLPVTETKEDVMLDRKIDVMSLIPEDRRTLRYRGSLTTPPCSEGVHWTVMQKPIELSGEQIEAFKSIFPMNARPVQARAWRAIYTEPLNAGEVLELKGPKPLDVGNSSDSLIDTPASGEAQ